MVRSGIAVCARAIASGTSAIAASSGTSLRRSATGRFRWAASTFVSSVSSIVPSSTRRAPMRLPDADCCRSASASWLELIRFRSTRSSPIDRAAARGPLGRRRGSRRLRGGGRGLGHRGCSRRGAGVQLEPARRQRRLRVPLLLLRAHRRFPLQADAAIPRGLSEGRGVTHPGDVAHPPFHFVNGGYRRPPPTGAALGLPAISAGHSAFSGGDRLARERASTSRSGPCSERSRGANGLGRSGHAVVEPSGLRRRRARARSWGRTGRAGRVRRRTATGRRSVCARRRRCTP